MKKTAGLVALLLCVALLFAGCGGETKKESGTKEPQKTPEEVVKQYFAYWADQDIKSMNTLLVDDQQIEGEDLDVSKALSVKVSTCKEVAAEDRAEWDQTLYENPYAYTYVDVDFEIAFEDGAGAGLVDGSYAPQFSLVRESETSPWKIVTWGLG